MDMRLRHRIVGHAALAAALLAAAPAISAQTRPEIEPRQAEPVVVPQSQTQTPAINRASIAQQRLQVPLPAAPDAPRTVPINWVEAREDARQQTATTSNLTAAVRQAPRFPQPQNEAAQAVTDTRLPVLIPASGALGLEEPRVLLFPFADFYNLSITGPDIVIEVFGTRLAHAVAPDPATARRLRAGGPGGFRITRTRYGQEVTFNRYGAAYSLTIECDAPESDPRCTGEAYARQLADSLLIAAGRPDEGGN